MENLGLQAMTLSDGTTAFVQQDAHAFSEEKLIEGQMIELEDGSTAFIQQVHLSRESITFEDGQSITLEDGTMAFIHHAPKEGYDPNTLEAIQLEDGSTAFIHRPVSLPTSSTILAVQADVRLEGLAVGEENVAFDLDTITALKEYASQGFQEEEVQTNGKGPLVASRGYRCGHKGCGRLYSTADHLRVHERVHTGIRPYRCDFSSCGKTFATGYSLKNHVRIHTGERPFSCPFEGCGRSFTTSNIRKVHIRTHTGERPYMCPEPNCGRGFTSATNYKNHMRIHTGEKPYACMVPGCGKRFTEYSSLYKHHVVHTHCKPYTCSTCGKTYRQTSTLAMHKRTAHGELEATEESEQALYEQQMKDTAVKNPLKFQHVTLVKVKTEKEDRKPVAVEVVSQDGTEQLEEQQSPEDAVSMAATAAQQESIMLMTATSNDGC